MTKREVFYRLIELELEGKDFLDSLPTSIQPHFFDTPYINSILKQRDVLVSAVFGNDAELIDWFLFEWRPGYKIKINGITTIINCADDLIEVLNWNE